MAVSYTRTLSTDMIVSELEALVDWQGDVLKACFFPSQQAQAVTSAAPTALLKWCQAELEKNTIDPKVVERFQFVHAELCKIAGRILGDTERGEPMTEEMFDGFHNQVEAMVINVRRLQKDMADSAVAIDALTGLRTVSGMVQDIKREQDRFDRKGTSFSISSIYIDQIDEYKEKLQKRDAEEVCVQVANAIAKTIRSFDDAYYLGLGEYILVLKHVDFLDACSVMDRLRKSIEQMHVILPDGTEVDVTASFGIAEAMRREQVEILVEHAKAAMMEARDGGGNRVSEHREMSALEQYAKDVKKEPAGAPDTSDTKKAQ